MNAKLIIILATSLIASTAFAGNWKQVDSSEQESVLMDVASIQMNGDEIQVKVLRDYSNIQLNLLDGQWFAYRSKLALYSVDCSEGKLGHLEWILHKAGQGRGRVVHEGKVGGVVFVDAPVNAGDRALVQQVCASPVAKLYTQPEIVAELNR